MTTPSLIGTPLATDPFLELLRRNGAGDPGTPLGIYSKLATTPKKIKASRSLEKMALVTDLRADDIVALGTGAGPSDVPTGGVRAFSYSDRFLFLGANGVRNPMLFERSSLFYRDTGLMPDLPVASERVGVACFSKGGRYFICTFSATPDVVQVYNWVGADEYDPAGTWEHAEDPLVDETASVTRLWVSPMNNYLIVQTSVRFRVYDLQDSLAEVTPSPITGQLLAINSDETEWVFQLDDTDVQVASFDAGVLTVIGGLPSSNGTNTKAAFSGDDQVIIVLNQPDVGTESPRFYSRDADDNYVYASGEVHASSGSWSFLDIAMRPDGEQIAIASADGSASRVELYSRDEIVPEAFTPDGAMFGGGLAVGGMGQQSRDGMFGAFSTQVVHWNGSGYALVAPSGYNSVSRTNQSFSHDGEYLMACSLSAIVAYRWGGSSYSAIASPIAVPANVRGVGLSHSGLICAVMSVASTTATLRFFQYSVGTNSWTQIGTNITFTVSGSVTRIEFCPGRDDLVAVCVQGMVPAIYKLDGGVFVLQAALPNPAAFTYGLPIAWSPDGNYLACALRDSSLNWRLVVFFRGGGDSFTLAYQSPSTLVNGTVAQQLAYAVDGKYLVWTHNSTSMPYALWQVSGATYTPDTLPSAPTASSSALCFLFNELVITNTSSSPQWKYDTSGTLQTFTLEATFALTGTAASSYLTYNPDGTVLHYGRSGDSHHVYSSAPYSALTELSFASDRPASDVYNILYSPSGKCVFFFTPDGPEIAVRPNIGSDFLNAKDIEGCFVFLYDLEGDYYVERGYSQHKYGSIIRDLEFSENEAVFCYHAVLPADAAEDAVRGRIMYDITDASEVKRYEFRGAIWEEEMTDSLIAFSPWNTHFVVTHEHLATGDPVITLHEFTTDYNFVTQDTKPVSFGPPDFSKCDDVVVAHGGIPQMTFFKHDDDADILIPRPVDINWDYEGAILDVAFRDDCEGIVILTPDELYPLEPEPDDPDEYTPDEPTELDDDVDEDDDDDRPDLDVDEDDDIKVDPPDWEPPQDYDWDPLDPDKPISSINYVPYVAVTVTFRVRSIPS